MNVEYFSQRLDLKGYSSAFGTNLSVLVYIQGWELVLDSAHRTGGWGLGFQQLGLSHVSSAAADQIYRLSGLELNLQDGGFNAAKVLGEFGIFGLVMILAFLGFAVRCGLRLRQIARGKRAVSAGYVLALSIICSYLVDMFVRGLAYFSATTFLFAAACFLMSDRRSIQRQSRRQFSASAQPARPLRG
jgi:hypothetical protein